MVSAFPPPMLFVASATFLFTAGSAEGVAPDAGSIVGNQASASYDDGTGIKTATSNTVQTTLAQVASSQSNTVAPGQTVIYISYVPEMSSYLVTKPCRINLASPAECPCG